MGTGEVRSLSFPLSYLYERPADSNANDDSFASRMRSRTFLQIWYENTEILQRLFIAYGEVSATHLLLSSSSSVKASSETAAHAIDHAFNHAISHNGFCELARRTGMFRKSNEEALVKDEDDQDSIASVAFSTTLNDEDT